MWEDAPDPDDPRALAAAGDVLGLLGWASRVPVAPMWCDAHGRSVWEVVTMAGYNGRATQLEPVVATLLERGVAVDGFAAALLDDVGRLPEGWVDARDAWGRTALHLAAERDAVSVASALLEAGADPTARDLQRRTPLQIAASPSPWRHGVAWRVARVLRARGLVPTLVEAIRLGDLPTLEAHLDRDPAAVHPRDGGEDPLVVAIDAGHLRAVAVLLGRGADPNRPDRRGRTAAHHAVARVVHLDDGGDVMRLLALFQVDLGARDAAGRTPADLAADLGRLDLATAWGRAPDGG